MSVWIFRLWSVQSLSAVVSVWIFRLWSVQSLSAVASVCFSACDMSLSGLPAVASMWLLKAVSVALVRLFLVVSSLYSIQLYCLCVEKFAFWLVIYIETFNKINNKTSTTQWNTELKTAQIQGKYLTITMYIHTHARSHPLTPPPPPHTHTLFTHYIYCDMSLSGLSLLYRKCGLYRLWHESVRSLHVVS